jgi:hypothetical protein
MLTQSDLPKKAGAVLVFKINGSTFALSKSLIYSFLVINKPKET